MTTKKRLSSDADDGEEDDLELVEVDTASASLRPGPRKRSRLSPKDRHDDYDGDDGSDIVDADEEEDEATFMEHATQFASEQRRNREENQGLNLAAENGVIESVTCVNFMCHKHLSVTLGPLINFITGRNGSGKSAILAALTICLGGKATATNRGGSLKNFIKNGEETAMLSVKLKNQNESGYQNDVYGDSITVERQFSRSGASSFKLKSSTGRLISTRKGDLDDICDYFALQIDNPMNVLTQDMARQFLNNSTPQDKYKFFMKGTQLEHLDGDYMIVEQNVEMLDADLWKKNQDVEALKAKAEKAEHVHRAAQKSDELDRKILEYSDQLAWVQVGEQERKAADADAAVRAVEEKIATLRTKFESMSEGFRQSEDAHAVAVRNREEAQAALIPVQEEKESIKLVHDKHKKEQLEVQTQQRQISGEIKNAADRVKNLQRDIEEENWRLSEADGGRRAERQRELQDKETEAENAKERLREHEAKLPELEDRIRQAKADQNESQRPINEKNVEIKNAESRLTILTRDRGQQQNAYHASMPRLLRALQDDDGFREKPIGPIGNHVQLLKPSWSSVLEKQFGSALDSFIVTSKSDQSRLQGHMQRIKCFAPILIGNNQPIDTTGFEPDPEYDTTLRVLAIDNELVRKQLIIGQAIDQTILIAKRTDAVNLMNAGRLRNVKQCFSHNVEPGTGVRFAYGSGGGLSETFIPRFQGNPRMKTDIESQISNQNDIVRNLKSDMTYLQDEFRKKRDQVTLSEQAVIRHKRNTGPLRIQSQRAQSIVETMQDELDGDAVEEGRLDSLKRQLEEATGEEDMHTSSYQDSINAKDSLSAKLRTTREQMAEKDKLIEEAEARLNRADARVVTRVGQRETALREKNAAEDEIRLAERDKGRRVTERDDENNTLADFMQQATEMCGVRVPVDPGATTDSIEKIVEKLHEDKKTIEKRLGGSREAIANSAARAHGAYQRSLESAQALEELAHLLKTTLVHRRERWRRFQKYITSRARVQFFYQLSERGFRGKLLANHKEKKLDLQVEPDESRVNAKGRSTHGLSGGEKSFSTLCLLLAIWEAMGAPVRCLDEFDVFMDSVNREISMDMLVRAARDSARKQFILITPQGMTGKITQDAPDVHVVRMPDPVRNGQTQLNFPVEN